MLSPLRTFEGSGSYVGSRELAEGGICEALPAQDRHRGRRFDLADMQNICRQWISVQAAAGLALRLGLWAERYAARLGDECSRPPSIGGERQGRRSLSKPEGATRTG